MDDVYPNILRFTSCGQVFKSLRLTCKVFRGYFERDYWTWVDRFCNHATSILKIDPSINVHLPNVLIDHVDITGQCSKYTLSLNKSFTYDDVKANPDMFDIDTFVANPNCTVDIFIKEIMPKQKKFEFIRDNLESLLEHYDVNDIYEIARSATCHLSIPVEVTFVDDPKTTWSVIEKYPQLRKYVGQSFGVSVLTDPCKMPTTIIRENYDIIWCVDDILSNVRMTDDLYLRYHDRFLTDISMNATLTIDFIRKYQEWDWQMLTIYAVSVPDILDNADLPWRWQYISYRDDLTVPMCKRLIDSGIPLDFDLVARNCNLTSKDFFDHPDIVKKFPCDMLLRNATITYPIYLAVS